MGISERGVRETERQTERERERKEERERERERHVAGVHWRSDRKETGRGMREQATPLWTAGTRRDERTHTDELV